MATVDDLLRAPAGDDEEATWPPRWMLDLERAHDRLRHAAHLLESGARSGPVDLRPGARALERAYQGIFDAFDERRPRAEAARDALSAIDEAVEALSPAAVGDAAVVFALDYLRETRIALADAQTRLAPLVPRPPQVAADLRASFEVPRLHAVDRASLTPHLRVPLPAPPEVEATPAPIDRPKTFDELERVARQLRELATSKKAPRPLPAQQAPSPVPVVPEGFALHVGRAVGEAEFVGRRVRECFEEVVMIGVQRTPLLGDPWRSARILERRMLASIDAIVAMGPYALGALETLVLDAPLKDPSRLFGLGMVLGCIEGRDALGLAERVFDAFELEDPGHAAQLGAALKLLPHPHLPLTLRTLLEDPDDGRRALAIDVLTYRGAATDEEIARAAVDEPKVAAIALPWLALCDPLGARSAIDEALGLPVLAAHEAAYLAMIFSGDPRSASALRHALDGERAGADRAAALLGIIAGERDAGLLLERARAMPVRGLVTAVGWAGHSAAVPALIELLAHDEETVVLAAAYALDRITNAGLYEDAVVEAEEILVPDVPEPEIDLGDDRGPRLGRMVSDPRDMPAEPSTDTLRRPSTRIDLWRAYWKESADRYDAKARYRRGYPYTPLVSWRELDQWPCTPGERRLLQWELIARTGGYVRFDPHDFVPTQEQAIAAWEAVARQASGNAGGWTLPARR